MGDHDGVVTVPSQRTLPLRQCTLLLRQCDGSLVSLSLSPPALFMTSPMGSVSGENVSLADA